jgi:hypothetical protein
MSNTANSLNIKAAGIPVFDGTATFTETTTTLHNVLVGAASNAITSVAPSATSGVPLISQGAAADPAFGTAVVAGGGTGVTTMTTAYAPVCAGTTATGNLQVASTGLASSGFVLTSTGSASLPTFQAPSPSGALVLIQTQTVSGVTAVNFTTGITSSYNNYFIAVTNFNSSTAVGTTWLTMSLSTDGGSTYITTGYFNGLLGLTVAPFGALDITGFYYFNANIMNLTSGSGYIISPSISSNSGWFYDPTGPSLTAMTNDADAYGTVSTVANAFQLQLQDNVIPTSYTFSGTISLYGYTM